jgi:hypothetical protein
MLYEAFIPGTGQKLLLESSLNVKDEDEEEEEVQ